MFLLYVEAISVVTHRGSNALPQHSKADSPSQEQAGNLLLPPTMPDFTQRDLQFVVKFFEVLPFNALALAL